MFAPSPFRSSHRRSRSHSSLSSPSTSPVNSKTGNSRPCPTRSPVMPQACGAPTVGSALDSQPPEKWDVEAWRRGKRARRDPKPLPEDTDMDYADEPMSSSPILDHSISTSSTSAPSTPHLASTSDAFHFFPTKPMATAKASYPSLSTHTPTRKPGALEQMPSDAFGDLRSAVSEAGEGFVRRMRELEASRSIRGLRMKDGSPSSSSLSHTGAADRRSSPLRIRGRKRPSPTSARCPSSAGVWTPGRPQASEADEDDSDVDIDMRSSYASGSDDVPMSHWSPSKKRAVSLSALSAKANPSAASLPYAIPLRSRDRSSSPLGSPYSSSSEDEDEDGLSRRFGNRRSSRLIHRRASRFVSSSQAPTSMKHSTSPPPLSFSFSNSNNSSRMSLPLGSSPMTSASSASRVDYATGRSIDCETPGKSMQTPNKSKKTERAVAAISLAMANGAGSVSDYEALRDAKDLLSLDHGEAGDMWD